MILFHDDPGKEALRASHRDAHIQYMRKNLGRVLASGGLLADDGETAHGGLMVLDTDSRADAERFVKEDPFFVAGLYSRYTINRWRKAFLGFQDLLPK
jgi:uncharacterized protein YciI